MNEENQPLEQLPESDDAPSARRTEKLSPEILGETTYDVSEEAKAALERFEREQRDGGTPQRIANSVKLRIELKGVATPMALTVKDDLTIGRRDPTKDTSPGLDLTPHGAYQMGISRNHAILRITDEILHVVDLGSRNGTYLNGRKVNSESPAPLRDGDELRLGKIVMRIYFQTIT